MTSRADSAEPRAAGQSDLIPLYHFWHPRYWGLWLVVSVLRLLTLLPLSRQMSLGRSMGRYAMRLMPDRRNIARINLHLCFPEHDEQTIDALVREHFESLGMAFFDLALSWWISDRRAAKLVDISGVEWLEQAIADGRGVVILSGHFPGTELIGVAVQQRVAEMAAMYRPFRNRFVDQVMRRSRRRAIAHLVPKGSMRRMIRLLRNGTPVWYAPDQAYDRKYSALVPFFGVPAMTNCALTHIARLGDAQVVPFLPRRRADYRGYVAEFLPPLADFPSGDEEADARRVNRLFEEHIRKVPAQYYWVHRRFKNRPPPHEDPYADI
ncbi:MAG: LpxL/LpxP family Kdo(2)-lipid IV(A) lauroyl/palmitoleoyl acyltransferase [Gammaproteobacteria bacterium]